jgi:hypothetical protein
MAEATAAAQLSLLVDRLLEAAKHGCDGLTAEQFTSTWDGRSNSIAFDVFHVSRTADNVIHFVFEREQPVWLSQGFFEAWDLPKVDQGTGMDRSEAFALKYPAPTEFTRYIEAVRQAIVPRIGLMSDEYLATITKIAPWGEIPRIEIIGQVLIAHGNGHLGRVDHARSLLGLGGLGY